MVNIIPAPVEVKEDSGFDPKIDIFERQPFGESLTRLVQALPDGGVIALDSKWGEGKSTFVKMWLGYLLAQDIPSIRLDAFEHDYSDDPFVCISAKLLDYFENEKGLFDGLKGKTLAVAKSLFWSGTKIALRVATLSAVQGTELEGVGDDISQALSEVADKEVWARINAHKSLEETIRQYRTQLEDAVARHTSQRMVFVIDELDQCRPDFAVAMVEQIKHLFTAKGVVFVLVINSEQLQNSVNGVYGQKIDAEKYLQKFINIWSTLPPKRIDIHRTREYSNYIKDLFSRTDFSNEADGISENLTDGFELRLSDLARAYSPSLRELEKIVTNIIMSHAALSPGDIREPISLSLLSTLKVMRPDIFDALLHQKWENAALRQISYPGTKPEYKAALEFLTLSEAEYADRLRSFGQSHNNPEFNAYSVTPDKFGGWDGKLYLRKYTRAMTLFLTS